MHPLRLLLLYLQLPLLTMSPTLTSPAANPETSPDMPPVLRTQHSVAALQPIPPERRALLAANPEGKTPDQLNALAPEINAIEVDNTLAQSTPRDTLRIVAWNMERGRHWRDAVHFLAEHPAFKNLDILLLSEMDLGMARSANQHTTREVARALGMNYAYFVEFIELSRGKPDEIKDIAAENQTGYHGNAILARFPLANLRGLRFPGIERWYGSNEHRLGGRNALLADIEWHGNTITLISTHLESKINDGPMREQQIQFILDELAAQPPDRPVILGGDLNTAPNTPPIQRLRAGGFDVDAANDLPQGTLQITRNGKVITGGPHIDYLALRGMKILPGPWSPAVVPARYPLHENGRALSDHAPVTLEAHMP